MPHYSAGTIKIYLAGQLIGECGAMPPICCDVWKITGFTFLDELVPFRPPQFQFGKPLPFCPREIMPGLSNPYAHPWISPRRA